MTARTYIVTITPRYSMHSGSWASGAYTTEVIAKDRAHAIKIARRDYEDGAVNPAKFTACLKES